jgi:electron transfer flavoprotein alpha subunit
MDKILLLLHTEADGGLHKSAYETLAAAQSLGGALTIGLVGADVRAAADSLSGAGAEKILGVTGEAFASSRYATDAAAAEALCKGSGAAIVLAPETVRWSRALGGVAQRLGGRIDTHVTGLAVEGDAPVVSRWFYRQRMMGQIKRTARPWIIVVAPGCFEPAAVAAVAAGSTTVEAVAVDAPSTRTTVEGLHKPAGGEQTIRPDAKLLFVAGAGWMKKQASGKAEIGRASEIIRGFLGKSQASLGSSKSLVDIGSEGGEVLTFMSHLNQVGQTGATPRHPKGLSTCCHGEEPHVVGWRFVNDRRAINLDPNCGWAQGKANVLYVADAFEVMEKINALLG